MGAVAVVGANSLAIGPVAPAIADDLGVGVAQVMLAAAIYGAGTAAGALGLSPLIDRFGATRSLFWSLVVVALAGLGSALASGPPGLIAAQGLAGLAAGVALPACYALAAQIARPGEESRVLGRVLLGWTLSLVFGVSASALVADLFGWRTVFACFMALSLAVAAALRARRGGSEHPRPSARIVWPLSTLGLPGAWPLLMVCFAFMTAFYGTYGYIGDHITGVLGQPVRATALLAISYGLGFGLAALGDPLIDRFGARRVLPLSLAFVALVYGLIGLLSGGFILLLGLAFVWGTANHFGLNLIVAGLSRVSTQQRGAVLGLNSAVTYLAASFGALVGGPIYLAGGIEAVAFSAAAIVAGSMSVCRR